MFLREIFSGIYWIFTNTFLIFDALPGLIEHLLKGRKVQ